MIEIFVYNTVNRNYRSGVLLEELSSLAGDPELLLWVNFKAPTDEETTVLRTVFDLDPLAIEDCIHPRQAPKLELFENYLFFIIHGVVPPSEEHSWGYSRQELHGFLSDRFLITYSSSWDMDSFLWSVSPYLSPSQKDSSTIKDPRSHIDTIGSLIEKGTTYLAYKIIDHLIDMYLPVIDYFDKKLENLERSIGKKSFVETTSMRYLVFSRQILSIRRTSIKNQEVLRQLSHVDLKFIGPDEARLFKDIYDHVVRVVDMSEYYQQAIRSMLEIHLSLNSNRVNHVVELLTVIATITLPLYIITGIYGMNFQHIPLSDSPNGFYIIIALMIFLTIGMLYNFHKRNWI